MSEYSGIYGRGYQEEKNLYLPLGKDLILVRELSVDRTYHVGVIDEADEQETLFSLLEDISLKEWRKFFVWVHKPGKVEELRELLRKHDEWLWSLC